MDEEQPNLPLDERFRQAEQYAFDFTSAPQPQSPPKDFEEKSQCGRVGYCYCPRCNPR